MSATAMIIGGGQWQVALIRRAAAMGLRTVVTDRQSSAPGRDLADAFYAVDMHDIDGLTRIARRESVSLVISDQTDRSVPTVARLNEDLDLPGIRPEVALRFTNKKDMRLALRNTDVHLPRHQTASSCEAAGRAADQIGYPVVIKPCASQSSIGVFRIRNETELRRRFGDCLAHSNGAILVEQYIDGPEFTVEGIALAGRHHVLAVSEKAHYPDLPCVAYRLAFPPHLTAFALATIETVADTVVTTLGLHDGLTHAEYRLRDGIPYLIEVAARGCGHGIASTIVPHVSGVDLYGLLLRRLLHDDVPAPSPDHRAGLLEFLRLRPGRVRHITGLDDIRGRRLAHSITVPYRPGDLITAPTDDTDRGAYFIILEDTRPLLDERAAQIRHLLRVIYE